MQRYLSAVAFLTVIAVTSAAWAEERDPAPTESNEPEAAQLAQARELFHQATASYQKGDYAVARELFQRANTIAPGAATFRALGFCDLRLGNYPRAIPELEAALADSRAPKALTPKQRREVEEELSIAKQLVGRVLVAAPATAIVEMDGRRIEGRELWVAPGTHTLRVLVEGRAGDTVEIETAAGQVQQVVLALPRTDGSISSGSEITSTAPNTNLTGVEDSSATVSSEIERTRTAARVRGFIGLGVGVVGVLTGVATGYASADRTSELKARCDGTVCPPGTAGDISTATTLANVSNVSLGVGVLAAAYGVYELLSMPSSRPTETAGTTELSFDASPTSANVVLRGKWQ